MRSQPFRRLAPLALTPLLLTLLAGCVTTTGTAAIDVHRASTLVACEAFQPISWSTRDTDPTIAQVKEHNAAYKSVCRGTTK